MADDNQKIAINSVIIFVRLCVVSLVSIFASRLVLDALGASDYGLYNVVGGIVTLLNVINAAMLSTTYRFIAFEIGRKEEGAPAKIFSTSFYIHLGLALLILLLAFTVGDWYINHYLNVAEGKLDDALFVFHISVLTTAVSTLFIPFQGLQVAYENFKDNAIIDIVSQSVKLLAIFLFIYSETNRLRLYSIIMMAYTLLAGCMYVLNCRRLYSGVVSFRFIKDKVLVKSMWSYAVWTLFGALASVGKNQGSALIINLFFGTVVNAAYAVANQLDGFVLVFARSLNSAAVPQITKSVGGNNAGRSVTLACYISKYTFFLMSLVAFPLLLEMDFVLGLWLKEVPETSAVFCKLIVLYSLIGCLGEGIPALVNATGNIKVYQIVTHTFTLLGLPVSFLLCKLGFAAEWVLIVFCIINFILAFIRLYLLKRIYDFDVRQFFKISYVRMFYVLVPMVAFYFIYLRIVTGGGVWIHFAGIMAAVLFLLAVFFTAGLEQRERAMIGSFLGRIFKRKPESV